MSESSQAENLPYKTLFKAAPGRVEIVFVLLNANANANARVGERRDCLAYLSVKAEKKESPLPLDSESGLFSSQELAFTLFRCSVSPFCLTHETEL